MSLKHAKSATDPWLLATSLPAHRNLAKRVVAIYQQRMQIEEGFRDMKSNRFGLGFEYNNTVNPKRLAVLILLATLASLVAIIIGMAVCAANKHKRFQANTSNRAVLSFHTLGLRAWAQRMRITKQQWQIACNNFRLFIEEACHESI